MKSGEIDRQLLLAIAGKLGVHVKGPRGKPITRVVRQCVAVVSREEWDGLDWRDSSDSVVDLVRKKSGEPTAYPRLNAGGSSFEMVRNLYGDREIACDIYETIEPPAPKCFDWCPGCEAAKGKEASKP